MEFSYVTTHIKANIAHDSCLALQSNDLTVFWGKVKIQVTDPCCLPAPPTEVAGTSNPPVCHFLSAWFTTGLNTSPRSGRGKLAPVRRAGVARVPPFNFKLPAQISQRSDLNSLSHTPPASFTSEN